MRKRTNRPPRKRNKSARYRAAKKIANLRKKAKSPHGKRAKKKYS